jgi:hypothetical protein
MSKSHEGKEISNVSMCNYCCTYKLYTDLRRDMPALLVDTNLTQSHGTLQYLTKALCFDSHSCKTAIGYIDPRLASRKSARVLGDRVPLIRNRSSPQRK